MTTTEPSAAAALTEAESSAPAPRQRRGWPRWLKIVLGAVVPLLLLGAWLAAVTWGDFSTSQLPPPQDVVSAGWDMIQQGTLWQHVAISTQRVFIGFVVGSVVGLVLGGAVGLSDLVRSLLAPTIGALRAVPSLAWVPLLLLWLGIGETPKIVLVAIGAFFPVYTTVSGALAHVDRHLVEVGRAYGRTGVALFGQVQLPAIAPSVLSGLRLALAQSWLFLVAAELIASSMGLGFLLTDSQNTGRTDILLLSILLLAVLGKLTDAVVGIAERVVLGRWA